MPRFLVTERTYVAAVDEAHAVRCVHAGPAYYETQDRTVERVAPELEVGMPVRLVSTGHGPQVYVPIGSEGVVMEAPSSGGEASVLFHARYTLKDLGSAWTLQMVHADDLEVVEGWSS